jgi:ABC-type sulfate/molybdate transport systems ATPase subunit
LARALAAQPAALLLDEPLSALDQPVREELREVLRDTLRELAVPAIHVTHDRDEALRLADDLAILAAGTLRQSGPAGHLTRHPTDAVTARLLGWAELGPVRRDTAGLYVGDLPISPIALDNLTGTVYYRPEEVLIDTPDQPPGPALRVQTQVLEVVPTLPLARVRLSTNPPIIALILHRDLDRLPQPLGLEVEVTLPQHAIRVIRTEATSPTCP